ncbi:flagellin [Ruegeria arenilitoris]|uniref:flagellin n=1 Tax=Ruegeria arenilitoris TaxID=1173585 RepID=UPI00147DFF53|nr:flagellin [Ruegeria arenilitoris]
MSSILTNNGAMVALQTLKSVNKSLTETQNAISTGKTVANAKDNAAVWAISKVMESDVRGFGAVKDSLALGEATVSVARNAAETVYDLLTDMNEHIQSAQNENVDRATIQRDIDALKVQITDVVSAAQFNGLNLLDNDGNTQILSSLDRDSSGNVAAQFITVSAANMGTGGYTAQDVFADTTSGVSTVGDTFGFALNNTAGTGTITIDDTALQTGDTLSVSIGELTVSYTLSAEDIAATSTKDVVAIGLKGAIENLNVPDLTVNYDVAAPGQIVLTNAGSTDLNVTGQYGNAGSGNLGALAAIDVTSNNGPANAQNVIHGLMNAAADAAAGFGSVEGRLETQKEFISKLTDSFKSGIGALVDADMEETSARLQALQVQQQLATQSLSIANQAPQSILSLFR